LIRFSNFRTAQRGICRSIEEVLADYPYND